MPFAFAPRARVAATARACRAIVAARLLQPGREHDVLRALQLAWFTTTLVLDEDADIATALATVDGLDVGRDRRGDRRAGDARGVRGRQARRRAPPPAARRSSRARRARPTGRCATRRRRSSSRRDGQRLEAGGFQPIEAYDVLIANLDRTLAREAPAEEPAEALARFPGGLVTSQEVAAIMAHNNQAPDRAAAERALVELVGAGAVRRTALGDDALWQLA